MKIKELINKLNSLKDELKECDVKIIAQNGLLFDPVIKFQLKEKGNMSKTKDNVLNIILTQD